MTEWQPPSTAPKHGKVFRITTAGPNQDLCWYDKNDKCFRDYFHKQKITNKWPYMVAWAPLDEPAKPGKTYEDCCKLNGWKYSLSELKKNV